MIGKILVQEDLDHIFHLRSAVSMKVPSLETRSKGLDKYILILDGNLVACSSCPTFPSVSPVSMPPKVFPGSEFNEFFTQCMHFHDPKFPTNFHVLDGKTSGEF